MTEGLKARQSRTPSHSFLPEVDYMVVHLILLMNGLRTPFVVAGENLNMPFIGGILRSLGAFFIRRPAGAQGSLGRALRASEIVVGACLWAFEAVCSVM